MVNKSIEDWEWKWLAVVNRIIDGDTIEVGVDRGFRSLTVMRLRLHNIDTEEMNDKDSERAQRAQQAKELLENELLDELIILQTFRVKEIIFGKERATFNRYEAKVHRYSDNWDPVQALKDAGLEKKPR